MNRDNLVITVLVAVDQTELAGDGWTMPTTFLVAPTTGKVWSGEVTMGLVSLQLGRETVMGYGSSSVRRFWSHEQYWDRAKIWKLLEEGLRSLLQFSELCSGSSRCSEPEIASTESRMGQSGNLKGWWNCLMVMSALSISMGLLLDSWVLEIREESG